MQQFSQRIYVQYKPAITEPLLELQEHIAKENPDIQLVPEDQLHMTVIHFGIAQFVFNHLQKVTEVKRSVFEQHLEQLIEGYKSLKFPELTLNVRGVEAFGPQGGVAALKLKPNAQLEQLHEAAYEHTRAFFMNFGLSKLESEEFMREDRNLLHAHELNPHISLARRVSSKKFAPNLVSLEQVNLTSTDIIY